MKNIILAICGFFLLFTFTGCIDIFEEIILNEDGGGHARQVIDMSQLTKTTESLTGNEKDKKDKKASGSEEPGTEQLSTDSWKELKDIEGITNVKIVEDTVTNINSVDFDFKDETALNKALSSKKDGKFVNVYNFKNSVITRSNYDQLSSSIDDEDKETADMMKLFMSEMKHHISVTLPGNIKSVSNKKAEVNKAKKTVTLVTTQQEIWDKETTLEMKINYKKN